MVVRMKWLPKLLRRPGESQEDAAERGSQVLREQADAAEGATLQPQEPTTSEPAEPTDSEPAEPSG
jgi:hypothetical protein